MLSIYNAIFQIHKFPPGTECFAPRYSRQHDGFFSIPFIIYYWTILYAGNKVNTTKLFCERQKTKTAKFEQMCAKFEHKKLFL